MLKKRGPDPDWIAFSSTEARWINFNAQMRVQTLALAQIVICNELNLAKDLLNQTGSTRSNQIRPFLIEQIFLPYAMAACQPVSLSTSSFGSPNTTRPSLDEVEVVAVTKIWWMLGSMMPWVCYFTGSRSSNSVERVRQLLFTFVLLYMYSVPRFTRCGESLVNPFWYWV